jgi:hypothetical protein
MIDDFDDDPMYHEDGRDGDGNLIVTTGDPVAATNTTINFRALYVIVDNTDTGKLLSWMDETGVYIRDGDQFKRVSEYKPCKPTYHPNPSGFWK